MRVGLEIGSDVPIGRDYPASLGMDQRHSVNFEWLSDLPFLVKRRGYDTQAIRRFGTAERLARFSPTAASMLCRAGLEIVVKAYWEDFKNRHALPDLVDPTLGSLITEIREQRQELRLHKRVSYWKDLLRLNADLNVVVHGTGADPEFEDAVSFLKRSQGLLSSLFLERKL